jgi:hypothetical protein
MHKYLVTNFAHGNGPYLRTTELALALNAELEKRGEPRLNILVPWVYGDRQKRIMQEQFAEEQVKHPGEIALDPALGEILRGVFYQGGSFEESIASWTDNCDQASVQARSHLEGEIQGEDLSGKPVRLKGEQIVLELQRSPRVRYGVATAFCATFAHFDDVLRGILKEPTGTFSIEHKIVKAALKKAENIEKDTCLHCVSVPDLFEETSHSVDKGAMAIPPTVKIPAETEIVPQEGIYVTVSGIPGMERLYRDSIRWNLPIYTNAPEKITGGTLASPAVLKSPKIRFHFGRSGWGSVWLSQLTETPFVAAPYDTSDDPEIYFNNRWLERSGIGKINRGESADTILNQEPGLRENARRINKSLLKRFNTLDGNQVAAKFIGDKYLSGSRS